METFHDRPQRSLWHAGQGVQGSQESHDLDSPIFRAGMYVPTRREVAVLSTAELPPTVIDWLWEGPSGLIPNNDQISQLRAILLARFDAAEPQMRELIVALRTI